MNNNKLLWVEIDLDNLISNLKQVKALLGLHVEIAACVKANAYGHGAVAITQTLLENGVDQLSVATLDEGIELRDAGYVAPIFIMGYTLPIFSEQIIQYDFIQTVYSWEQAFSLSKIALKLQKLAQIFIKIDTGMGRIGLKPSNESIDILLKISQLPNIVIKGIFTHFACADSEDKTYTYEQYRKFESFCQLLRDNHLFLPCKSCCNSAAIINFPELHADMVRPGLVLYGLLPSIDMRNKIQLKPLMSLKTTITHVKSIQTGESVSYGRKYIATKET